MLPKITKHLLLAFLVSLIFFSAESIYRYINPLLEVEFNARLLGELLLTHFLLLSLPSKRAIYGVYAFFTLIFYVQLLHFSYYGGWIFPLEFYLFFSKFKETVDTFFTVVSIMLVPTLISSVMAVMLFYLLSRFESWRLKIPVMRYILIAVLLFIPGRVLFAHSKHGARPSLNVNVVRNSIEAMGYFLGGIVPRKVFGMGGVEGHVSAAPNIKTPHPDVNIVFIIGETLTPTHMSLFGYQRKTTPKLDMLKNSEDFVSKETFAAGVCTDVSIPSLINVIKKPDGLPQIVSANTCLFKLAKANGFKTTLYSAQSPEGLKHIKGYICMSEIDELMDSTGASKKQVDDNAYDEVLLERIKKVDFSKNNFLVLHQIGSHSPHEWRYPKAFDKFSGSEDKNIDYYDNSVLYSDYVLSELVKYIGEHSHKPTYVIFTSDHATVLDKKGVRGHGKLSEDVIFKVPFFIKAFNVDGSELAPFKAAKRLSHYEISRFIEKLLGYDTEVFNDGDYYVCGKDIEGLDGYAVIHFKDNMPNKRIITP